MAVTPPRLSPILVSDAAGVDALASELSREPVVALDTESNSFHVYRERVCLIQVSTRAADWVLDPFAVDPRPLGPVLTAAPAVVLHGADYDVRCLKREYGFALPGLFDTMAAARRLGRPGLGLSALVEGQFGVRLAKDFQRSDWGRRPLTAEQVSYAALDTHFLLALYDVLAGELEARGLTAEARSEFARIGAVEPRPKVFDPEGWRRLKASRELDGPGRAVLRALWIAREERASALDRPPFKVMPETALVETARRRPRTAEELLTIPGITPVVLRRMGDAALEAVRRAIEPGPDRGERPS
jgi:ribonuclease D